MRTFIFSFAIMIVAIYGIAIAYNHGKYVYVEPTFTQSAYQPNCFYDYYSNHSLVNDLTCPISNKDSDKVNTADSRNAQIVLSVLGVGKVTDQELCEGLQLNQTIIVLHNEYVCQTEFDYLNSSKVIYLYPNAMYVLVDYSNSEITLINGHGFPSNNITNGFNWKYDNTKYELSNSKYVQCNGVNHWKTLPNGSQQLNCYGLNPIEIFQSIMQVKIQ